MRESETPFPARQSSSPASLEPQNSSVSIRRVRAHVLLSIGLGMLFLQALHAQQPGAPNEAEKKRQFLKAREEMRTIPLATPAEPAPKPRPKPIRPFITPQPEPTPAPPTPRPKPEPEPTPKPKPPPERETPRPKPEPTPLPKPEPTPRVAPPRITPPPVTPAPRLTPQVIIEKSNEQGDAPAPPRGWFTRWKYLDTAVRKAIDRAPVKRGRWRYIVVHNSGTRQGSAKAFEYYHRRVRRMENGMAYHFVIGNGRSTGDGEIEIGNRWIRQINGGHVHSDYLNNIALGICLVGDFNRDTPTRRELEALEELIRYLRIRVGKIDRRWAIVKAHREINPPRWPTDCPGDRFPYRWLHSRFD